jgi:hypothetical protein
VGYQCERPTCAEPATVAYAFDAARCMAWLEPFDAPSPGQGRLCRRHADAMVVPKGWWLEDRRSTEQLFAPPSPPSAPPARARRLLPPPPPPPPVEEPEPTGEAVTAWVPAFVAGDDLDGVLNATSPLLARAFGRVKGSGTRAQPPARGA